MSKRNGFSLGIEVLVSKAAVDPEFRRLLLERRAEAAEAIGLELNAVERAMLGAIPREQIEMIVARTEVPESSRRAFMGQAAATMLAALGLTGTTGCGGSYFYFGHKPDGVAQEREYPPTPSAGISPARPEPLLLRKVHFDYDKTAIRSDQVEALEWNLRMIKDGPYAEQKIAIEGHADERGSLEYNFALGERRAIAVRDHLVRNGVDGERLLVISKGKEKPADPGHDEAAWAQNRRVEFKVLY